MRNFGHAMLASLPMYDLPEIREATDAYWAALAEAYGVTGGLTRVVDWIEAWRSPELLFSQTCGYPFTHEFRDRLNYVATPHYDADGCEGPLYCSIVFAREAAPLRAFKSRIAAFNSSDSMSGFLALKLAFADQLSDIPYFSSGLETGGHTASLTAVQNGGADVCAIDCVTVSLLRKNRPSALEGLVEIARSPGVPGLPYVTQKADVAAFQTTLLRVLNDTAMQSVNAALLLKDASLLSPQDYDVILHKEQSVAHLSLF